jgi:protein arginine kinase activator
MSAMDGIPCQRCGAPANRFLKLVAGGQTLSLPLCAGCAGASLLGEPLPASAAGLVLAIPLPRGHGRCPACGFRWVDFERQQRLGCPECYQAHADDALELVARHQPELAHKGRRPGTPVAPLQRELEGLRPEPAEPPAPDAATLEARLAKAVADEDYEAAARLRDALAALRKARTRA